MRDMQQTRHRYIRVDERVNMFYREAGPPDAPTILLLHGFPSSSIQFRYMLAELSDRWRLLAPDLPGFGFTRVNPVHSYAFTFDGLAATVRGFLEKIGCEISAVYLHDYGAQAGFRLLTDGTIRPRALIVQNSEAYQGTGWYEMMRGIEKRLADPPGKARAELIAHLLNSEGINKEFTEHLPPGILDRIDPAVIELAKKKLSDPMFINAMTELHMDYGSNIQHYTNIQRYFRTHTLPALVIWGKWDQYLSAEAAQAYRADLPDMELIVMDGGHWLLETHSKEVNAAVRNFLARHLT